MKHVTIAWLATIAAVVMVAAGCAPAASAPTAAPTAASKAPEPTKAPAAPPTTAPAVAPTVAPTAASTAPAKTTDWPQKGRAITLIVPYAAGGSTDISARMVAAELEKELGTPVQVVNKVGGGSQVGNSDVASAKPDGYTAGYPALPTIITSYLDPERKAAYTRQSFAPVARTTVNTVALVVRADSPYKNMKDLVDDAKAKPEQVKIAGSGLMSVNHLPLLMIQKAAGVKFAVVNFDGSAPGIVAMMGGHVDAASVLEPEVVGQVKAGEIRVLGVADTEESKVLQGGKTMASQGYNITMQSTHSVTLPAGTPKEVVDALSRGIGRVMEKPDVRSKMENVGLIPRYLDAAGFAKMWEDQEKEIIPLMSEVQTK